MLTLADCLYIIAKDIPNFIISLTIIIFVVFCTSYTNILLVNKKHCHKWCLLWDVSYNKVVGYTILLTLLDLTHVVVGNYEYNGVDILFIHLPAHHAFYDIYVDAFSFLFFREVLLTLKNINKLGINLNSIINLADKLDKKIDNSIESKLK